MRVLPVLDLQGGRVVRGIGGQRREYRPVVSRLTSSCRPMDVAEAFRARLGLDELYVADLDALGGAAPALVLYRGLRERGFRLWVDAGLRTAAAAAPVAAAGVEGIIAALETLAGPAVLADLCREFGQRVVFSLDLRDGIPLGDTSGWDGSDADTIAAQAVECGVGRILVLDLVRVGGGSGTGTEELCRLLVARHPGVEISAGGGVRGVADLRRLGDCGVSAVLVASALHDGGLTAEDVRTWQAMPRQDGRHS
jgi:phosphoribosylformimino-5-aminoimidazole carboxamide ribotide isomerase